MCDTREKPKKAKDVYISSLENGVLLECHCVKTYFPTIEAACAEIIRYYNNPDSVQKEYVGEHA